MSVTRFNRWLNNHAMGQLGDFWLALDYLLTDSIRETPAGIAWAPPDIAAAVKACPVPIKSPEWLARYLTMVFYGGPDGSPAAFPQVWATAGMIAGGLKVFVPTLREFDALARVEIKVPVRHYRQPFETFVMTVPDDAFPPSVSHNTGSPVACAIRYRQAEGTGVFCGAIPLNDIPGGTATEMDFQFRWVGSDGERTIEDVLLNLPDYTGPGSLESESEEVALDRVKRATINAALLASSTGMIDRGKMNPAFAAKLEASLRKKKLPATVRAANRKALDRIPTVYGFDQHIKLYVEEKSGCGDVTGTGGEVCPHWRRGHWANQPCGVGRAERRLIFRPAVLVNADRLTGPLSATRVTMTASGV